MSTGINHYKIIIGINLFIDIKKEAVFTFRTASFLCLGNSLFVVL